MHNRKECAIVEKQRRERARVALRLHRAARPNDNIDGLNMCRSIVIIVEADGTVDCTIFGSDMPSTAFPRVAAPISRLFSWYHRNIIVSSGRLHVVT